MISAGLAPVGSQLASYRHPQVMISAGLAPVGSQLASYRNLRVVAEVVSQTAAYVTREQGRRKDAAAYCTPITARLTADRSADISRVVNTTPSLHIVLHQPEIPQNTGNIGRTCVALGAKLWLVKPLGFQLDEKHLRRAGLDYWQHLDWEVVDSLDDLTNRIANWNPWYFSKTAKQLYSSVPYQRGDALVFGRETTGLPRSWLEQYQDRAVRIPIRPLVRSLNLANAVAVAGFEALRQWNVEPG